MRTKMMDIKSFQEINNERGVALVMVLILSLISLAVVSAMLFMVTQGTRMSGYHKIFRTAEEAGLGAVSLATEFVYNHSSSLPSEWVADLSAVAGNSVCLEEKLMSTTAKWTNCEATAGVLWNDPSALASDKFAADNLPDLTVQLSDYTVFTKIVETVGGNSQMGGGAGYAGLVGSPVVSNYRESIGITPELHPWLYRMEIQAQKTDNPRERSRYSVLYAY